MHKTKLFNPLSVTLLSGMCLLLTPLAAVSIEARAAVLPSTYGTAQHGAPNFPPFLGKNAFDVDGVTEFPLLVQNQATYAVNVLVSNVSAQPANVAAWIDFNDSKTFEASEAAFATVPAGTREGTATLTWSNLAGVAPGFSGQTYSRFRISTAVITADMAGGELVDGEVEDYSLFVQADADGNGLPDNNDLADSDGDGIVNRDDLDSDNDTIPDIIEGTTDSDADGVADYLDLDSDNDSIPDIRESGFGFDAASALDSDNDGRADPWVNFGTNGLADPVETDPDNGVLSYAALDTDRDGVRDSIDTDSDNDGLADIVEFGGVDNNGDSRVDAMVDNDNDGIVDTVDADVTGGVDTDSDGIVDAADADATMDDDTDMDGIIDPADPDFNGDGYADTSVRNLGEFLMLPDSDDNDVPDYLDARAARGPIETGLKGGSTGCSISSASNRNGFDPSLPLLAVIAAIWVGFGRRRVSTVRLK